MDPEYPSRSTVDTSGVGSDGGHDPLTAARQASEEIGRKRGRPPGSKNATATPDERMAKLQAQSKLLEKLYKTENWKQLGSMYFDARYALTGYEDFQLSPEEKENLADSLSLMVQVVLSIDPRLLVILLFTANFGGLIASKEIQYAQRVKKNARIQGKS